MSQKYQIKKNTEDRWWDPFYPPPGWWLFRPDGRVKVLKSWGEAIKALHIDIANRQRAGGTK